MARIRFCTVFLLFAKSLSAAGSWELPVSNLQAEVFALEERFTNQEIIMEDLRRHVEKGVESGKEFAKFGAAQQEGRLKKVETELLQTKNTLLEAAKAINQYKDRIDALEKDLEKQGQNILALKDSLQLALEKDFGGHSSDEFQHVVSSGESLEKIAKKYKVTIEGLKSANNLSKETIFPGQKLKIPGKA